jgi:hypothetical protein
MAEALAPIALLAALGGWLVLQLWLLPRLGVPT